jgi:hypothetical protein
VDESAHAAEHGSDLSRAEHSPGHPPQLEEGVAAAKRGGFELADHLLACVPGVSWSSHRPSLAGRGLSFTLDRSPGSTSAP